MTKISPIRQPTAGSRLSWPKALAAAAAALALAGSLAACAGSSTSGGTASPNPGAVAVTQQSAGASAGNGNGGVGSGRGVAGGIRPAAVGVIAALSAGSMQVQSTAAQTTVNYTSATKFSLTAKSTRAAVKVGVCVVAAAATPQSIAGGAPASGIAQPPTSRPVITALTAATVQITQPVAGSCNGGFAGGPGAGTRPSGTVRPSRSGGNLPVPSGAAGAGPAAGRGGFTGFGERTSGKVSSAAGSTIVVEETDRTTNSVMTVTVTVTGTTAYTATGPAKATAVKVGLCAIAIGTADSTGAVAAKSIALSPAQADGCTAGFGGAGGRSGGQQEANTGPVTTNG